MPLSRRRFLTLAGASAAALALPALADGRTTTLGGPAFASYWRLTYVGDAEPHRIENAIVAIVASVDRAMSPYRADSEVTAFNRSKSTEPLPLSPHSRQVVDAALALGRDSGGVFDPTVGPIVGRFGFGPLTGPRLAAFDALALTDDGIAKHEPTLSLDLCGIAKGHALDRIAASLDAEDGVTAYLLELGGEVFARGRHPSGRAWQIAIEKPVPDATQLAHVVAVDGRAVATSGNTVNGFEIGGRTYGHIIDPRAGAPATGDLASVSVMHDTGMTADGLATALMAMGFGEGAAFAQSNGIDALFLARDGDGFTTATTGAFADHVLA